MDKLEYIIKVLENKGLQYKEALELLKNNLVFSNLTIEEVENEVFALFNGPFLYAMIYCKNDSYSWCLFDVETNTFGSLNQSEKHDDYVIRMMMSSIDKMLSMIDVNFNTLQEKLHYASKKNISGYKIK